MVKTEVYMAKKPHSTRMKVLARFCSMSDADIENKKMVCGKLCIGNAAYKRHMGIRAVFIKENPGAMTASQCLSVLNEDFDIYKFRADLTEIARRIKRHLDQIAMCAKQVTEGIGGRAVDDFTRVCVAHSKLMLQKLIPRYNDMVKSKDIGDDCLIPVPALEQAEQDSYAKHIASGRVPLWKRPGA
jgi:hypothetical protein